MAKSKKTTAKTCSPVRQSQRTSVDIKKANNGFVVSQWNDKGEKVFIAKDRKEASKIANKLLGI